MGVFKTKMIVWNPAVGEGAEALAVAADPVHKKLLPIIPLALVATLRR
jgi:hypothetical protein